MTTALIVAAIILGWVLCSALIIAFMRGATRLRQEEEAGIAARRAEAETESSELEDSDLEDIA